MTDLELINLINERLIYEPDTGIFRYKIARQGVKKGDIAGALNECGYTFIAVRHEGKTKRYLAHRVAWLLTHKKWPDNHIDHINRNRNDNRIVNLRDVTRDINSNNTDKVDNAKGWQKHGNRYRAQISVKGKVYHLGLFDTPEEAHEAYVNAKKKKPQ